MKLRASTQPHSTSSTPAQATRSRRAGWRNPRLFLGIVLVAGSVVLGGRILAAADDSVGVWALARDLPAGATLGQGDLQRTRVRFPDAGTAHRYLGATDSRVLGSTLNRAVSAGELLPRGAFAQVAAGDVVEVPISVVAEDLPATVRQGSVVDVWVTPKVSEVGKAGGRAVPVLRDVVVIAVPRASTGFAPQSTRQLIIGLPAARNEALGAALGGMSEGRIVIARKG